MTPGGVILPGGTRRRVWNQRQRGYFVTTFTPTKTAQTDLLAWADYASLAYTEGTALDVSGVFSAAISIKIGRLTGTAFTAGSPNVRIQGSLVSSGNDQWTDLYVYQPAVGASIAATTANGAITANDATFVVASATNIAAGDKLFLGHTTDTTKYELITVKSVSGTTITPVHNVVKAHDTGALITDQAEEVMPMIGLQGYLRLRAVVDNNGSGQGIKVEVKCTTLTNIIGT